jgi:antitoxin YefM
MLIFAKITSRGLTMAITASEARAQLFPLIAQVNANAKPLHITSKQGNAVLVAESEWEAMLETLYVLGNPVNAKILLESIEDGKKGKGTVYRFDQLDDLFGARKAKKVVKKKAASRKKVAAKARKRKASR